MAMPPLRFCKASSFNAAVKGERSPLLLLAMAPHFLIHEVGPVNFFKVVSKAKLNVRFYLLISELYP